MTARRLSSSRLGASVSVLATVSVLAAGTWPAAAQSPAESSPAPTAAVAPTAGSEIAALATELERGVRSARLPERPAPYFAELRFVRAELLTLDGSYGGIATDLHEHQAGANLEVRVGTPDKDNGGFFGGPLATSFQVPLRPSGSASRRTAWLGFDTAFRDAVSAYEAKQAAAARMAGEPPPPGIGPGPGARIVVDWNDDPTSTADPDMAPMDLDRAALRDLVRDLSDRFNDHPRVDNGDVTLTVIRSYETVISTEGLVLGRVRDQAFIAVVAEARASDGMPLDAGAAIHLQAIPRADASLRADAEAMVDGVLADLEALMDAPLVDEDYDGPVLLEPRAAAAFLSTTLGVHAVGTPAPMSDYGRIVELEPFLQERLGKAVMPDWIDVVDDPTAEGFGHYEVDGEGMDAARVHLVKKGVLADLLMTRTPNEHITRSNGHARTSVGLAVGPAISNLALSSSRPGMDQRGLEAELLRRAREDGYEHAFVVERMRDGTVLGPPPRDSAAAFGSGRKVSLSLPDRLIRLEADGTRTLVRGAIFSPVSLRALRRIRAVGKTRTTEPMRIQPGVTGGWSAESGIGALLVQTVDAQITTPALLVDGLELLVERGEHERLPVLPHPLRRGE